MFFVKYSMLLIMCGIFGVIAGKHNRLSPSQLRSMVDTLFRLSESRGKEAAGLAFLLGDTIKVYKQPIKSRGFIRKERYRKLFTSVEHLRSKKTSKATTIPVAIIGHSRLATHGFQTENQNNQPVATSDIVGIHNGIIVNDDFLWLRILKKKPKYEVDTEALLELIRLHYRNYSSIELALQKAYAELEGSASIAVFLKSEPDLILATNTGSLYFSKSSDPKAIIFASESYILRQFKKENSSIIAQQMDDIVQVEAGNGYKVNLFTLKMTPFLLLPRKKAPPTTRWKRENLFTITDISEKDAAPGREVTRLYSKVNSLKKIMQHDIDYEAIYKLRRCVKCILPETMPFITFNEDGVCSYCKNHKKIQPKGRRALEKLVEPYRSKRGEVDCIIAFSGGRDSSYGLHFLKRELGMNPIAYTYDWGMVTDLARRNEARLVGKLGVEHIIVSADITMKRDHIRKHILAWMKKPDLGMVPLFMEGDKQCEYYADELGRKAGVKLIFFCRGNELENEEFKWGHCGIRNATPNGIIHNLSFKGKVQIAAYYAWQYLTNPAYINSSTFDTLFAYFSTYIQKHDYIFLWHYVPWEEEKIISTLKREYGWETETNSTVTWRTDDGTSAFYNYIYYTGQGFTENDTFRSNQIREGILTRQKALEFVGAENKPRYEALKWYFDRIGLDGHEVLTAVDEMPELY